MGQLSVHGHSRPQDEIAMRNSTNIFVNAGGDIYTFRFHDIIVYIEANVTLDICSREHVWG